MAELKAIIFDVDGTLADTEEMHRQAFNIQFTEAGLDWFWSKERYLELLAVTGGKERMLHFIDTYKPAFEAPPDLDQYIAQMHKGKTEKYTRMMASGQVTLRTGVKRLLEQAKQQGVRLAIATTTTLANVEALLASTLGEGGMAWFDVIGAGDMVQAKKPAPDIYDYVLRELGLDASECVALEDSENGIQAARAAGLTTVISTNDFTRTHNFDGAALVVDHLGEPDQPFTVAEGNTYGHTYLNLELLRHLLAS
ncbi:MAG: HAD family hydrolase [Gammaproteobacteria bacterium]|nr:HAD family hydrolase [Gammaproteobacteria bacterium]MDH5800182.1 HAD family hydrolase [Gammaproteobacteria bacterium]